MKKIFEGTVVAYKTQNTAIVEVERFKPHPIYGKRMRRTKRYKVDTVGVSIQVGEKVKIVETRPLSKDKNFKIEHVISQKEIKK